MPDEEIEYELDEDDDLETVTDDLAAVHDKPAPEERAMHVTPAGSPPEPGIDEQTEIMEALAVDD